MVRRASRPLGVIYSFTVMFITVVLFLVLSLCFSKYFTRKVDGVITKRIDDISVAANAAIPLPLWQFNNIFLEDFLDTFCTSEDILYASILAGDGTVFEAHDKFYSGKTFSHFNDPDRFFPDTIEVQHKGKTIGQFRVVLDIHYYSNPIYRDTVIALCITLASICLLLAYSYYFMRKRVLLPVENMSHIFTKRDGIKCDLNPITKQDDELGVLFENLSAYLKILYKHMDQNTSTENLEEINKKLKIEIIERHQAEKLLRISEKKFRYVLNNSPDTLYTIDLLTGNYEYISPSCKGTTGYSQDEIMGFGLRGILTHIHTDDRTRLRKHFMKNLSERGNTPASSSIHYRFKHKSLGYRDISDTRTVIFDNNQNPISVIGSARDITEQKSTEIEREKLEKKLRQSQKMEAIGTLAGGIAHDFNNILGAILGYADMAKEDVLPGSSVDRDLNEIIRAGDRAKELVRQILSYSRKEAYKQISVSMVSIVKETIKLLRATIPSNITIHLDIDPQCGHILADPTQIHQVLMNLCANASHAVEKKTNGYIQVTVNREAGYGLSVKEVSLLPNRTYIILRIKDNGEGIDPEIIDRIFDPYFTTKEVGKGSGMGLTVVTGIIKSHGGLITVKSNPGEFTQFTIYFPEVVSTDEDDAQGEKILRSGKGTILLVDDEPSIVHITKRRLERLGYEVTAFSNSQDALNHFTENPYDYDLIITDQTMPELTGDQLSVEALKLRPAIPIIICTGYSERIDDQRAKEIGVRTLLMKPVDKYELADAVSATLKEREVESSSDY